ncbi:TOBE domain-containing protein, partial [Nocardioides sp.]|uniref:TOBE domain-containing protein n=1 Tax=Nocardioides sp. TaxID=35761 RepID=UPI002ED9BD48
RSPFAARIAGLNMVTGTWHDGAVHGEGVAIRGLAAEPGPQPGDRVVAVFRPAAVSVFREAPGGSPRNSLRVTVTDLEPHGDTVRVRAGHLAADVTVQSAAELDLAPGVRAVFAVKANEVSVYAT